MPTLHKADIVRQLLEGRPRLPCRQEGRAFAPSNIALCKYWGKRNDELNLPVTDSLSVSLGELGTTTVVAPLPDAPTDVVRLNGTPVPARSKFARGVTGFLDLVRPAPDFRYHVDTVNTVPTAAGLASSASGFAALALAVNDLCGWELSDRALSILARLGSGSAARSVYTGFVQWHAGAAEDGMDSFAEPLPHLWPALRIGLVKVSTAPKDISSREAMKVVRHTSALYETWPVKVAHDLAVVLGAIESGDFGLLGQTAESNALTMHATGLGAWPPILFWLPESVAAMHKVWALRETGHALYFTMDAGPNLKLLFLEDAQPAITDAFPGLEVVTPFPAT